MHRNVSRKIAFATFAATAFLAGLGQSRADTPVSWSSTSGSGNWSDAADWSPAVSPNGAYSVTLPDGSETVTLDVSPTIDSLTLGDGTTLQNQSATSLTTSSLDNNGGIYFTTGGTLTVNGDASNSGNDYGQNYGIYLGNAATLSVTGNLTNTGGIDLGYGGGGNNILDVSGTFTNSGRLNLNESGDTANLDALNNQGYLGINSGTTLNITGGGQGVTDVAAGSTYYLSGSFNVINGGVTTSAIANLASVEGGLYLESGQTYNFGTITNSGSDYGQNNGIYLGQSTTMTVTGNVNNTGGIDTGYGGGNNNIINVSGTFTNSSSGRLNLSNTGDTLNANAFTNQGYAEIDSGATLNITGGGQGVTDVAGGSTYYLAGNFNVINGGVTTSALANLASVEGGLYLESGKTYDFGSISNSGNDYGQNYGIYLGQSTTINVTGDLNNSGGVSTGYGGGDNNIINVSGAFNNTAFGRLNLSNTGDTLNANTFTNQGYVEVDSGATLNITGGGQGVTDVAAGSTYYLGGSFNVINGGVTTSALANLASVEGGLYLESGQTYNLGTLTNSGNDYGQNNGIYLGNSTTISVTGDLNNTGGIDTGYGGGNNNIINVSGTFTNSSSGRLNLSNTGDTLNANAFSNQGYIQVGAGAAINITGGGQGVTDVPSNAQYYLNGSFNVINGGVTTSALANLASVEGILYLDNGQTYNFGPLTNSGDIDVSDGTTVSVTGDVTNSGTFTTGTQGPGANLVNVSGTFDNTGTLDLYGTGDVVNVHALNYAGSLYVAAGATLNVTGGGSGLTDVPVNSSDDIAGNFNVINGGVSTSALANLASVEGDLYLESGQTYNFGPLTNSGFIELNNATTASITGDVTNSGELYTGYFGAGGNTLNVSGTFSNSGTLDLFTIGDTANFHAFDNTGYLNVGTGAALNITGGGSGVTDVPLGATYDLLGAFNVINGGVTTSAIANLASVEGNLYVQNGQTYNFGPLTNSGFIEFANGTTATITGDVTNSGIFDTGYFGGDDDTVNVSGTFDNTSTGSIALYGSGDVLNVNALNNQGSLSIDNGAQLNITGGGSGITDIPAGIQYYIGGGFNVVNQGVTTSALAKLATVEGSLYLENAQTYNFGALTNSGFIDFGDGTTATITGDVTNSGTFDTGFDGGGSNTVNVIGTFNNSAAGEINLYETGDALNVNALNNQGYLYIGDGAALNITGGGSGITDIPVNAQYAIYGNFNVINGQTTTSALANLATVEGTLDLDNTTTNNFGPLNNSGTINIGSGTTANITGDVTNSGNFSTGSEGFVDDTVNVSGTFNNTSTGTLALNDSGDVVNVNALNNQGTVSVATNANLNITGGGMGITDVPSTATYVLAGGNINVINDGNSTSALANLATVEGTIYFLGQQTYNVDSFTNSGAVYLGEESTLNVTGNVTNSGVFETGYGYGGDTLNVSGTFNNTSTGTLTLEGSEDIATINSINNQGTVTINPFTTLNATNMVNDGTLNNNGGTLNVANPITGTGTTNISDQGTLVVSPTTALSSTVTINSSNLDFQSNSAAIGSTTAATTAITVNGTSNVTVPQDLLVAPNGSTATLTVTDTTSVVVPRYLIIGSPGGSGDVTIGGTASVDPLGAHLNDLTVQGQGSFTIENTTPTSGNGDDPVLDNSIVGGYNYNGALNVQDSALVTTPNIKLGVTQGYTGTVNQTGGTINVTTFGDGNDGTQTGGAGTGMANISGGTLNASTVILGSSAGGSGNAAFSGASAINVTNNINVGSGGGGSGTITSTGTAAVVIGGYLDIGGTGGSGDVTVGGQSTWDPVGAHLNDLTVNQNGTFTVTNQAPAAGVSDDPVLDGSIVGGYQYNGALNVADSALVTTPNIKLGVTSGFTGTVNQSGGTINVTTFGDGNDGTQTGGAGTGMANISGGTLNAVTFTLGSSAGGSGNAAFSGTGAINVTQSMNVGSGGGGSGTVTSAGTAAVVIGGYLNIGGTGGSGDVTVGGQSTWDPVGAHLNDLTVNQNGSFIVVNQPPAAGVTDDPVLDGSIVGGYQYNGALNVADSAIVTTPNIKLGVTSAFTGTVNQTGGTINVSTFGDGNDGTQTGGAGVGMANISGGVLNASTFILGSSAGGSGNAAFSGSSAINITGNMNVGATNADGAVTSTGNADVTIGGILTIGGTGGSGSVTVGGQSSWDPIGAHLNDLTVNGSGNFVVPNSPLPPPQGVDPVVYDSIVAGYQYNGALNVADSATVSSPNIKIGVTQGFVGTYSQSGGTVTTSNFVADNGAGSVVNITGGTLNTSGTNINTGSVLNIGDGTNTAILNLQGGTHTFTNGLNIEPNSELTGQGTIMGTVTNNGTIAPGTDPGVISVTGNLMNTGGLDFSLASLTSFDQLNITGSAALAGTIRITLLDGYQPQLGNAFSVLNFASLASGGATLDLSGFDDPGMTLTPTFTATGVTLTVTPSVPEPASMSLLSAVAFGVLCRRRRKSKTN
ncbi:MAG: PEP-CTERM sorting domain-containing protein [Tepidisphaeraceae bacterium]